MRYEARIASRIGPLVASTLPPARIVSQPPRTRLTIRSRQPLNVPKLLRQLDQLNIDVESLRQRGNGLKQSDPRGDR